MRFIHVNLYTLEGFWENCYLEIEDQRILSFGPMVEGMKGIDMSGMMMVPGFIDQHIHGACGHDFMDADATGNEAIAMYLPQEGVTSFLATTLSDAPERIEKALTVLSHFSLENGAECLGVHLEGPFLSPEVAGAHKKVYLQKPDIKCFEHYQQRAGGHIQMVTLAPEEDAGGQLIDYLVENKVVVSAGHTVAAPETLKKAVDRGLSCITHCYNAMTPLHHRKIGVVGVALSDDRLYTELIADGEHVAKEAVQIFSRSKPRSKVILVSDAMRAKGLEAGTYHLGEIKVMSDGSRVLTEEGTLAGSVLSQDRALKEYLEQTNVSLETALDALTINPASLLGVADRKGQIAVGRDADLVVLDRELNVMQTYCRGSLCYERTE